MARLWSCGFELQSVTSGVEWDVTTGSPAVSTTTKRTGAAALRCNTSAASAYLYHQVYASAQTAAHVYMRTYVYIASLPSAKTMIMAWYDNTNFGYGLRLHPDGKLRIEASNDFQFSSFSASALSTGQWYRIEIDYNDSTDAVTAYVNGSSVASIASTADTFGGERFMIGSFDAVTADLYFDDAAINDASGSAQNGLPGAGSIVHMQPDAAGDSTQWQSSASTTTGTATVGAINEVTPDDVTTYNRRTTTTTKIDDWNLESSSSAGIGASDTITLVEHGGRYGSTSTTATARTVVKRIKGQAAGTTSTSASTAINVNGWTTHQAAVPRVSNLVAYTNPQTSTAWTPSTLDTMQIGVQANTSSTNEIRYSTLWALIEFVPSASVTVSGTAFATATATAAAATARTLARSAGASAASTATAQTSRSVARTASTVAVAAAAATTIRTLARTANATATSSAVTSVGKTDASTAHAAAAAAATTQTARTLARTAAATAGATAVSATGSTKTVTATAVVTATATVQTSRSTARTASVSATARATAGGLRIASPSAHVLAAAAAATTTARSFAVSAAAGATSRATGATARLLAVSASAIASARASVVAVIKAFKVRESGAWVGATPRVREGGAWVASAPNLRESGAWNSY